MEKNKLEPKNINLEVVIATLGQNISYFSTFKESLLYTYI